MIPASWLAWIGFFHSLDESCAGAHAEGGRVSSSPIEKRLPRACIKLLRIWTEHFGHEVGRHNIDAIDQAVQVSDAQRLLLQISARVAAICRVSGEWIHRIVRDGGVSRQTYDKRGGQYDPAFRHG
jgi:hypothetical protein